MSPISLFSYLADSITVQAVSHLGLLAVPATMLCISVGALWLWYALLQLEARSYASRNQLAVSQREIDAGTELEWDRRYITVLGVANKRLYEFRLQTARDTYEKAKVTPPPPSKHDTQLPPFQILAWILSHWVNIGGSCMKISLNMKTGLALVPYLLQACAPHMWRRDISRKRLYAASIQAFLVVFVTKYTRWASNMEFWLLALVTIKLYLRSCRGIGQGCQFDWMHMFRALLQKIWHVEGCHLSAGHLALHCSKLPMLWSGKLICQLRVRGQPCLHGHWFVWHGEALPWRTAVKAVQLAMIPEGAKADLDRSGSRTWPATLHLKPWKKRMFSRDVYSKTWDMYWGS